MKRYIVLDTETASLQGGVVELAFVEINSDLEIISEFVSYVNPERPIDPGAQAIHGISAEMVEFSPTLEQVAKNLPEMAYMISHNIGFDSRMIRPAYAPKAQLCTLALSRRLLKGTTNHKLATLQKELGLTERKAHSALDDVKTCLDLLRHLLPLSGRSLEDSFELAKGPKTLFKMPFGKFKGLPFIEVPKDYRDWLMSKPDLDKDLKFTLTQLKGI